MAEFENRIWGGGLFKKKTPFMLSTMSFSSYNYFSDSQFKWLIQTVKMTKDFWPFKSHILQKDPGHEHLTWQTNKQKP